MDAGRKKYRRARVGVDGVDSVTVSVDEASQSQESIYASGLTSVESSQAVPVDADQDNTITENPATAGYSSSSAAKFPVADSPLLTPPPKSAQETYSRRKKLFREKADSAEQVFLSQAEGGYYGT